MNSFNLTDQMLETIRRAFTEDVGSGDVTSNSIIPENAEMAGEIIAKQEGVISGLEIAREVYAFQDSAIIFDAQVEDGSLVTDRQKLANVSGSARSLLTAERTALNFIGRMSGISTLTHQFVQAVAGTKARILDTRKTAPGLREFDKQAVRLGGGCNHRAGLYDMILIKDNHIDFAGSITEAVSRARSVKNGLKIEVETRSLADVDEALRLRVDRIMLDNMSCEMMRQAVAMVNGKIELEASGNVTLKNIRAVAETGVDFISIGALTHSITVFDVSFNYLGSK